LVSSDPPPPQALSLLCFHFVYSTTMFAARIARRRTVSAGGITARRAMSNATAETWLDREISRLSSKSLGDIHAMRYRKEKMMTSDLSTMIALHRYVSVSRYYYFSSFALVMDIKYFTILYMDLTFS
jgi:hypothetical protein